MNTKPDLYIKLLTKNTIEKINIENKILISLIKKIDARLYDISKSLLKIQKEIYGRVELYFGKEEVKFLIRQKLSSTKKSTRGSDFNLRYYTYCDKNILKRLVKKPQYILNKEKLKPLLTYTEQLIRLRNEIYSNKYQEKMVKKVILYLEKNYE